MTLPAAADARRCATESRPRSPHAHLIRLEHSRHVFVPDGSRLFDAETSLFDQLDTAIGDATIASLLERVGVKGRPFVDDTPLTDPPIHALSLAVAQKCNLGCTYCYAQQGEFGGAARNMENFGATVYASPTDRTHAGRAALQQDPDNPGSLGLAISEAVETAATSGGAKKYSLGSVLNLVLLHQTVIGQEALLQMEMAGEYPDVVIGCAGGGSNFAGFAYPFLHQNLTAKKTSRIIAVEPASCPSLTRGKYTFDYGDLAATAPVMKMHTLGHTFIPPTIHAGGLRYHGMAPSVSALVEHGDIEARAVKQLETFAAAVQFSRSEGIIPAPESAHAVRVAIDEALACKATGEKKVIAFNLSGHGHFDMMAYEAYHYGKLQDYEYPTEKVEEAMTHLPRVELTN